MTDRLTYTLNEAASMMGVHPSTIRNWIDQGRMPSLKIGGRRMVSARALAALVAESESSAS